MVRTLADRGHLAAQDAITAEHFRAVLRRERDAKGWSRAKLADLAGLHYRTVEYVESGRSVPNWTTAIRLAAALGLPLSAFTI